MNTKKFIFLFFIMIVLTGINNAQQTIYYKSVNEEMQTAKNLLDTRNYISALKQFEQISTKCDENSDIKTEAMFYIAVCGLKLDNGNAEELVASFMKKYPESSFTNRAIFEQASYQFDKKRYAAVLKSLEGFDKSKLNHEDQIYFYYMKAYSNFELEKYEPAASDFSQIKDGNSMYAAPAQYYWGHIHYLNGNYETALKELLKLKDNAAFKKVIPFYISQIYYKQEKYSEVVEYTSPLINNVSSDQQPELARILGNSLFNLRQFTEAIQFLEFYLADKANKGREENYMLGYCYYLSGKEAKAIPLFEIATRGKDELAQNAYYHLADCYVITNDKNKARQAFEAASEGDFDKRVKEDALFNYAKITYELSYSPFNETIKAFDKYISLYPNAERNDIAYDYLVKVYMSTSNYRDAIASIENIKVKTPSVMKAYQRVTYYRGLENFNNIEYNSAIENFNKAIDAGNLNKEILPLATFWKSEANYRLNNFREAIIGFTNFIKTQGTFSFPEFKTAHYNLAYSYFQMKDYQNAGDFFKKYINLENNAGKKIADANNRLGDCYFMNRDYLPAIATYDKSIKMNVYDTDYAIFQKALCLGLLRDNQGKINALQNLISNFKQSSFTDDALYELGRTHERINQMQQAISNYKELINKFPQSILVNRTLIQLGLVYYNINDFQSSINYYKQVVERAPNSPETQAALTGIKNNFIETNNVDAFVDYTRKLGSGIQISVNEQDSLTYRSAERLYMAKDRKAKEQFEKYLAQFPNGIFTLNSRFYLSEMLYNDGEYSKAIVGYEYVISQADNYFTETSLNKAAGLHYNSENYQKALGMFEKLKKISSSSNNSLNANTGIMRCSFKMANYQASIESASEILNSDRVSDLLKREINYVLAISNLKQGNKEKAFPILTKLAIETNSAEGAESKYLIAEILFQNQKFKESEKEIMDFIDKNSPHQFWLAKAFILLSDIYTKNNDDFQAKHTLKSIEENYPDKNDGIINITRQKLQQIEARESTQNKNQNKPLEINIGNQKK